MNGSKDKVIFLRHALSAINYEKKVLAEAGMMEELKRLKAGMDRRNIFMDPSISEEGFEQIHAIGRYLRMYNIKYVIVSPMMRTMQTALHSLFLHPNYPEIKFVIQPLIRSYTNDISDLSDMSLMELKSSFSNNFHRSKITIAWSWINNFERCDELYFKQTCKNPHQEVGLNCLKTDDFSNCKCANTPSII